MTGGGRQNWFRLMRNHYVPQFLQRPWTTGPKGELISYHLRDGRVHATPKVPKSVGYQNDMLSLTRDQIAGMDRHAIEEVVLKQVDNDAAKVWAKLRDRKLATLTARDRCDWVRFLMSLRLRAPHMVNQLKTESRVELRRSLREDHRKYEHLATEAGDPETMEEWTERQFPGLIENFGLSFFHKLLNDEKIGSQLLRLKWWVFDLSKCPHRLLLGDRPCLFFGGIEHPNVAVALPIAPDMAFIATRGDILAKGLPETPPRKIVEQLNDMTVKEADKYIFGQDTRSLRFIENRRT